ncbi:MAG: hypothetical protein ABFS10_05610 [Bacteroidota bacterium]
MKRINLIIVALLVSTPMVFGGGLVTNTNQSAAWARTLTRQASTDIDAVYFNPAGLARLDNGLHLSLSNQSIFQTRTIKSDFAFLNGAPESTYQAELTAPVFPSIYGAYKMDKWTFSAGFNIIGGGGSADFQEGLPSFEIPVSSLVPGLQASLLPLDQGIEAQTGWNPGYANITGYDMDAAFNGSSTYMGIQVGATYAINEMISVAIGGRYVSATNTYEGSLSGVTIDAPYGGEGPDGTQIPGDYLRRVADNLDALGEPSLDETIIGLRTNAAGLDVMTADAALDAVQKGSGFAPIIGVNLHLTDMVDVALKYEHHTKIVLTNETVVDDVNMFPDGAETRADLPGMVSLGTQLKPLKNLTAMVGINYFLDKSAYYGKTDDAGEQINNELSIDQNGYSIAASLEYKILDMLGVSAGFSTGNNGVNSQYQSDMSYALKSNSVGGGLFVDVGDLLTINAGFVYTMYQDYPNAQTYDLGGTQVPFTDTYGKDNMLFAVGVDIHL